MDLSTIRRTLLERTDLLRYAFDDSVEGGSTSTFVVALPDFKLLPDVLAPDAKISEICIELAACLGSTRVTTMQKCLTLRQCESGRHPRTCSHQLSPNSKEYGEVNIDLRLRSEKCR